MTQRWKLKTSSSNLLLVLNTLILVKAGWAKGENENSLDYTNSIDATKDENLSDQTSIYVGNDEIAKYFFSSAPNDNSTILQGINKCLDNFQLITCVKMLLLDRINDAVSLMEEPSVRQADVRFLNGLLVLKIKNEANDESVAGDKSDGLSLDEEITAKVRRIFWGRSLLVNVLPNFQLEIEPIRGKPSEFVCFSYTFRRRSESAEEKDDELNENEGRAKKKKGGGGGGQGGQGGGGGNRRRGTRGGSSGGKKKSGGGMGSMMMMMPQMLMMGLMPFTLASLKAMVMNAVMVNMMALNGAIFMTIRNLVFGPKKGDNVMYVNYGYEKDKQPQTKRPVLIIHSPAAFVKQPPAPRRPLYGPPHGPQNYFHGNVGSPQVYQNTEAWQHSAQNNFLDNSGSSQVFHNENADNTLNHGTQNNMGGGSPNLFQVENAEATEGELLDLGDKNSNVYFASPEGHNQRRRQWQGIRRRYRPRPGSRF